MLGSRNASGVAIVLLLCMSCLTVVPEPSSGVVAYYYDRTLTAQFPGPSLDIPLAVEAGDNVTITYSNFQGFTNKQLLAYFTFSGYYAKDDQLDDALNLGVWLTSNTPITTWVVFPKTMDLHFGTSYSDTTTSGSYDVLITRSPSSYASSYMLFEELRTVAQEIQDNITALVDATQGLDDRMTDLTDDVTRLNDTIATTGSTVADLDARLQALELDLDTLNGSIAQTGALLGQLQADLATLAEAQDATNGTLQGLIEYLDGLDLELLDLSWVEANLTMLKDEIAAMRGELDGLAVIEDDINDLDARLSLLANDTGDLQQNLTAVWAAMPSPYDDDPLLERVSQLEEWNELLRAEVDQLKEDQDNRMQAKTDTGVVYTALLVGVLGLVVGVAALLYRKR
jgi:uncharacterized protein YoxC